MQTNESNYSSRWTWIMVVIRTVLFGVMQTVTAGIFFVRGVPDPWEASTGWWPLTASLGSLAVIILLIWLYRREGASFWTLFKFQKQTLGIDLLISLVVLIVTIPVAMLPNILLAKGLFGDQQIALDLLIKPLPLWAVGLSLTLFPVSIALSELPNYFGYTLPRLEIQTKLPWLAVGLTSFWLAAQHIFLPFIPDLRFIFWRLVMFLPFAIMLAIILRWRIRLLPYLVFIHFLLDLSTASLVLLASI